MKQEIFDYYELLNMDLARDELYMVARWFEKTDNDKAVARRIYQLWYLSVSFTRTVSIHNPVMFIFRQFHTCYWYLSNKKGGFRGNPRNS